LDELDIDKRYEGIPGVSIGGYVAGLAAKDLGPSVAVTLTRAVPPGSTVTLERTESQVLLRVDGELAATAVPSQLETTAPQSVAPGAAERAADRYPGFDHRFFPNSLHAVRTDRPATACVSFPDLSMAGRWSRRSGVPRRRCG
jgi:pimeloyl-ACP methyl ester carboxylesterase